MEESTWRGTHLGRQGGPVSLCVVLGDGGDHLVLGEHRGNLQCADSVHVRCDNGHAGPFALAIPSNGGERRHTYTRPQHVAHNRSQPDSRKVNVRVMSTSARERMVERLGRMSTSLKSSLMSASIRIAKPVAVRFCRCVSFLSFSRVRPEPGQAVGVMIDNVFLGQSEAQGAGGFSLASYVSVVRDGGTNVELLL
jgi:hypothetical protein